jgi:hypothetical protein
MEKEKQLLLLCRTLIEQLLNWGDSSTWSNDDFEQLSDRIFEQTKVRLSISTLKRIWGKVRYDNFPTTATLNALTGLLGYASWRDFKQKNPLNNIVQTPEDLAPVKKVEITKAPPKEIKWQLFVIAAVVVTGIVSFIIYHQGTQFNKPGKIKFEAIKVSDSLPNSVIFNYDVSSIKADSVIIQQSWDPTRREKVPVNSKQHTSVYYEPGIFVAKLIVNGVVKKECPIYIQTKGWKGVIEQKPIPTYLSAKEMKGDGFMGVSDKTLREKTGMPVFNNIQVDFLNVREFKDIDASNFTFETTLRNASAVEASVCRSVRAILLGSRTAIIIPLGDKGCSSTLDLWTGDNWFSGKDQDMRAFGCDFSQFQDLKCEVGGHRFKIYLNNKLIFNTPQKYTLGKVLGIRFEFVGSAQIRNVKLSTPGRGSYSEQF